MVYILSLCYNLNFLKHNFFTMLGLNYLNMLYILDYDWLMYGRVIFVMEILMGRNMNNISIIVKTNFSPCPLKKLWDLIIDMKRKIIFTKIYIILKTGMGDMD